MNLYRIPGVSIAMGQRDAQIWTAGFGTVAAADPSEIGSGTIFQACSVSKQVAAFGTLRLVADRRGVAAAHPGPDRADAHPTGTR